MKVVILDSSVTVKNKIHDLLVEVSPDGLDIECFSDGSDALDYIKEHEEIDLIFSAIETTGLDGISFADIILSENPKLVSRLFIVTSQKNTEHLEDMKEVGAKRFIRKPINDEHFKHFVIPEIKKILK